MRLKMEEVKLTTQEENILRLVAKGLTNTEIGHELNDIDSKTVASHLININNKLRTSNRTDAVITAIKLNLITL
jgi:ATP/maltotriose-dependent transcriptional regulator MalT